ncbi:IS200/IS605 family element RNA-guided endonuclease TnpB [Carnobacterium mobile]|uniref:IS200/IS605 family element RNA-guided endonuclease TnpB n=1 Tax=Carnobacterium mobile TaxID=2750 RepID=UPI00054ECD03|nr:IS200/IS605 family element RNA-guided endonuclease TnpB [Carnobacterium mobile]
MFRSFRYRLYPNKKQQTCLNKTIGCSRFVYNHFLNQWNTQYKETGKGLSYNTCSALLTHLKKQDETCWLKEADSTALQSSLRDLADAFDRFFKKQNQHPRFKAKKHANQSYTAKNNVNNGNSSIEVVGSYVKLPKLKWVKFAKSREVEGKIISATVRRNPSGKYFVSLLCETEVTPFRLTGSAVGIDLGITNFAILSTGEKRDNHRFTSKMEQKLKREQRKLSRRQEQAKKDEKDLFEAKNYQKQRIKVAKLHGKIANQREDFLNKLSTEIIKNHDIICIEDLNVEGMKKNHNLAKSISDVSWTAFVDKLAYKAKWHGRKIVKVNRWFPSSQLCSSCGHPDGKKSLEIREWICLKCGTLHDRDLNASQNILHEGLHSLQHV